MVEGKGFEPATSRLRGAILESFLLNRLKSWAGYGLTMGQLGVWDKKGLSK